MYMINCGLNSKDIIPDNIEGRCIKDCKEDTGSAYNHCHEPKRCEECGSDTSPCPSSAFSELVIKEKW